MTGPLLPTGGARVLGLDGHRLDPGCWADLTLIPPPPSGRRWSPTRP